MTIQVILFRLLLAAVVSGFIGYDREFKNRPAGIRTHILVCAGATIIALIQTEITHNTILFAKNNPELAGIVRSDEARLIAQVISGIGFLGAGTIIVTKRDVKGLTTAASLWTVAGLGLAIGMGFYKIGLLGFFTILAVLSFLQKVVHVSTMKRIEIKFVHKQPTKEFIAAYFSDQQVEIREVNFKVEIIDGIRIYTNLYTVELPKGLSYVEMAETLSCNENMVKVQLVGV